MYKMRDWVSKLRKLDFLGYQMVKTDTLAFICLDTGSVYEGPKIADLKFNIFNTPRSRVDIYCDFKFMQVPYVTGMYRDRGSLPAAISSFHCRAILCISAAYAVTRCLSVRLSVTCVSCVKTNKDIFDFFFTIG